MILLSSHKYSELLLGKLAEQKYLCIIAGDINIELAKNDVHSETTEHVNTILLIIQYLLSLCLVEILTRVLLYIIDHIYFCEGDSKMNARHREIQKGNIMMWFVWAFTQLCDTNQQVFEKNVTTIVHLLYASTPLKTECN
jgi:hypothetical protein